MSRSSVAGFVGGTDRPRFSNVTIAQTINLIVERGGPTAKSGVYLRDRPGLMALAQVNDTPGSTCFEQNGRAFGVTGTTFWELFADETTISRGTVTLASSQLPAQIVSNGTAGGQLLVLSGGNGYVFDLNTNILTLIDGTNFPGTAFPIGLCVAIEFMDGYGIALTLNSREFHISALEDFTSWDPLDVAQRSEASDNLVGMVRVFRELRFLGTQTGEVWSDNGDALFPFAPVPGTFLEMGAISTRLVRFNDSMAWLGRSVDGLQRVYLMDGYRPVPISTDAVDFDLQQSPTPEDASLWTCQMEGHWWLGVTLGGLDLSWIYDATSRVWTQWSEWNPTTCLNEPFLAAGHMNAFNQQVVIDRNSGVLYALSFDAHGDSLV